MKVLLATPTTDGRVHTSYMTAVTNLVRYSQRSDVDFEVVGPLFPTGTLLSTARGAAAGRVLDDASFTHLLFIDSDTACRPEAVKRLIDFGQPFVGCLYPNRFLDLSDLYRVAKQASSEADFMRGYSRFIGLDVLKRDASGNISLDRGFAKTIALGTGLTLIAREVLERLALAFRDLIVPASQIHKNMGAIDRLPQFFESIQGEDGAFLSEDISFCRRWGSIGGEMWALIEEPVSHAGTVHFSGSALSRLLLLANTRPRS